MSRESGGRSITGPGYIKYQHGPVPSRGDKALKALKKLGAVETGTRLHYGLSMTEVMPGNEPCGTVTLTEGEKRVLDSVAQEFGHLTARELSDRSHEEPSWILAELQQKLDPELMLYGAREDDEGL